MAKASKYTYYPAATVRDELDGSEYTLGMTIENISIEISANTHPIYTGKSTLVDTAGRIDKFKTRLAAASKGAKPAKDRAKTKKVMMTLDQMSEMSKPVAKAKIKKAKAE
jgi:large subunit ribosomal protein L31